jgi:hypothetical protein
MKTGLRDVLLVWAAILGSKCALEVQQHIFPHLWFERALRALQWLDMRRAIMYRAFLGKQDREFDGCMEPRFLMFILPLRFLWIMPLLWQGAVGGACRVEVVDASNGWPVPLVELTTTSGLTFVTDNAGVVAFDATEFMGRETWLGVFSHGYEVKADGFGYRGVRRKK